MAHAAAADDSDLRDWCLSAALGIKAECASVLAAGAVDTNKTSHNSCLAACGEPLVQLLSRQATRLVALYDENTTVGQNDAESPHADGDGDARDAGDHRHNPPRPPSPPHPLLLKRLDDVLSIAYARFYVYLYKDLPLCWRQLYTDASILKFGGLYLLLLSRRGPQRHEEGGGSGGGEPAAATTPTPVPGGTWLKEEHGNNSREDEEDTLVGDMVKTLDLALILAGAGGRDRERGWIDRAFELLERVQVRRHCSGGTTTSSSTTTTTSKGAGTAAAAAADPSTAAASHDHDKTAGDRLSVDDAVAPRLSPPAKRLKLDNNNNKNKNKNNHDGRHTNSSSTNAAIRPPLQSELFPSSNFPPPSSPSPPPPQLAFSTHRPFTPPVRHPIRRVAATDMDMAAFQRYLDKAAAAGGPEPVILTGLIDDWPARGAARPWDQPAYLLARTFGGRRLVPVEVGRSYVDAGWGQQIVSFGTLLRDYIGIDNVPPCPAGSSSSSVGNSPGQDDNDTTETKPSTTTAYLAQHQLFLQLPHLRDDIRVPDHCYTVPPPHPDPADPSRRLSELDAPLLHAWLGPAGTITPLHTDPYHNLLVQVVGSKYVRLYGPRVAPDAEEEEGSSSPAGNSNHHNVMRARGKEEGGVDMGNTSFWDVGVVEGWDPPPPGGVAGDDGGDEDGQEQTKEDEARQVDDFRKVPFVDCILEPGDTLYIPVGWWHYVRGLSVSFSVSIWWN